LQWRRLDIEPEVGEAPDRIGQTFQLQLERETPVIVEKIVALYSSRDHAISECGLEARQAIERAPAFSTLLGSHARVWHRLWRHFDLELTLKDDTDDLGARTTSILRLHLYHLLVTAGRPSWIWMSVSRRGVCTAKPIAGTSSGTSSSSFHC
jgi:alpha,alpha-trehalase